AQPGALIEADAVRIDTGNVAGSENGTLGVFLRDNQDPPNTWLLSANHVIGFNNLRFTSQVSLPGQGIICDETKVVHLKDFPELNTADAAISRCKRDVRLIPEVPVLPLTQSTFASNPTTGAVVAKYGAASTASTGALAYQAARLEINLAGLV